MTLWVTKDNCQTFNYEFSCIRYLSRSCFDVFSFTSHYFDTLNLNIFTNNILYARLFLKFYNKILK